MLKPSRAKASWSGRSRARRSCSVTTPGAVSAMSLTVHFMAASLAPGRRTTTLYAPAAALPLGALGVVVFEKLDPSHRRDPLFHLRLQPDSNGTLEGPI